MGWCIHKGVRHCDKCDGNKEKSNLNNLAIGAAGIFGGIGGIVFGGMMTLSSFVVSIFSSTFGTILLWLGVIIAILGLVNVFIGTGNSIASVVKKSKK